MSDSTHTTAQLAADLRRLERKIRRLHTLLLGCAFSVCTFAAVAFTTRRSLGPADTLTTRRLVLVDENGAPKATFDLASGPQYGVERTPWLRTWLRISVDDPRLDAAPQIPDSAQDPRRGHAAVTLGSDGLAVTLTGSATAEESGLRLAPGPTLQLTRGDQTVYRIEPSRGVRPVLDRAP